MNPATSRAMNSKPDRSNPDRAECRAFTLPELLVVLAVVALLAATLLPALAGSRVGQQAFQCYNNFRQLQCSWLLYSSDYNDRLVQTGGMPVTAESFPSSLLQNGNWVHGNMDGRPEATTPGSTDPRLVRGGALYPYSKNLQAYKCPADLKTGPSYAGGGSRLPTTRSMSMNNWLNPLPGQSWNNYGGLGRDFRTQSDIATHNGGPSKLYVLIEENPNSINEGWFVCNAASLNPSTWIDVPANCHDNACALSFADGHVEAKRWKDRNLLGSRDIFTPVDPTFKADLIWLQERATTRP
jgi:prepilin-type N-terminal cleavage/methylation domain-containing protein/prepilin-type processing-associated H-X9-DG protein